MKSCKIIFDVDAMPGSVIVFLFGNDNKMMMLRTMLFCSSDQQILGRESVIEEMLFSFSHTKDLLRFFFFFLWDLGWSTPKAPEFLSEQSPAQADFLLLYWPNPINVVVFWA